MLLLQAAANACSKSSYPLRCMQAPAWASGWKPALNLRFSRRLEEPDAAADQSPVPHRHQRIVLPGPAQGIVRQQQQQQRVLQQPGEAGRWQLSAAADARMLQLPPRQRPAAARALRSSQALLQSPQQGRQWRHRHGGAQPAAAASAAASVADLGHKLAVAEGTDTGGAPPSAAQAVAAFVQRWTQRILAAAAALWHTPAPGMSAGGSADAASTAAGAAAAVSDQCTTLQPFEVLPLWEGGRFDERYNSGREKINFSTPPGTRRVLLEAVITGRGI